MSAFGTVFARTDRARSSETSWRFAGQVALALVLVIAATLALVETELGMARAHHLSDADLRLILE